jgi:hypothetical protein
MTEQPKVSVVEVIFAAVETIVLVLVVWISHEIASALYRFLLRRQKDTDTASKTRHNRSGSQIDVFWLAL